MNTGIVVVLLSLGVVCVVLGLLLLSLRRDNARLSDERAAADEARRLAEESRRVSEEKAAAAEIEIRTLVERSTLAQARLEAAEQRMAEARAEREKMEETFRTQFKNLANDILGEQSRTFKETNREALDVLLKPFRDNIVEFRERVEKIYSSENEQRGALRNELERLMELNRRITTETTNLTNALKGNSKVQGDWGEMILETILDNSNLIRGVHYDTQLNIKDETGNNLRPDVVLYLPEGKRIVIDSDMSGPRTRRPGASILRRTSRRCGSTSSNWVARSTSDCSIRPISSLCSFPTNRRFWRRCKTTAPSGPMPTTRKSSSLRRPIFSPY